MPLRDDLLNPIAGDNPSGVSLRYERVYDQIKEARIEEDDTLPTGDWERQAKRADFALVIKLAGEALANKSKDLQLAAWLAEAHVKREGVGLIAPCLKLFQDLQEQFWDSLYPEIEDGDAGMRPVPIEWACNRLAQLLYEGSITRDGLNFFEYRESRAVGYEADAEESETKMEARQLALSDGKIPAEDFDKSVASTPKAWYVQTEENFNLANEALENLQVYCEDKYGDDGPAFGKLRNALEEVGQVVRSLLNEKRKLEPDEVEEAPAETEDDSWGESSYETEPEQVEDAAPAATAAKPRAAGRSMAAEPTDRDDAFARVQACSKFLRTDNPYSPIPYLLHAALRFGELREQGDSPSWDFLVPPSTDKRQTLKRLASEENWEELLTTAIAIVGEPCGRAWLDAHRYIWKASYEYGYPAIASAVIASVQSLLKDIPQVPTWTLSDDTPTANPDTQSWLEETVISKAAEGGASAAQSESDQSWYESTPEPASETAEDAPPDALDIAKDMMGRGQFGPAIQLLMRDSAQQPSGRARFQRRLQIAQLCMSAGHDKVAHPVLEELVKEIDLRKLEEWEASDMLAPPFALLLRCLSSTGDEGTREAVFSRLCRIDPSAAMDASG